MPCGHADTEMTLESLPETGIRPAHCLTGMDTCRVLRQMSHAYVSLSPDFQRAFEKRCIDGKTSRHAVFAPCAL